MLLRTASNEASAILRHRDVISSGPMAALTVDAFRNVPPEKGGPSEGVASRLDFRIRIVTEHATVMDSPLEAMVGTGIVAGTHGPERPFLAVPAHRKLEELAVGRVVEVGSHPVAGTHHKMDLLLHHVHFLAAVPELVAPLEVTAVPLKHGVVALGGRVVVGVVPGPVFNRLLGPHSIEGAAHPRMLVGLVDVRMAGPTGIGAEVAGVIPGYEKRFRSLTGMPEGGAENEGLESAGTGPGRTSKPPVSE